MTTTTSLDQSSPNMVAEEIKKYDETIVYVVDDIDKEAVEARIQRSAPRSRISRKRTRMTEHEENCIAVREFFAEYTDCKVKSVIFEDDAGMTEWWAHWKKERALWTKDTLVIFYYHGDAGSAESRYHWDLEGYPGRIPAFKFINFVNDSDADALFLLDCFIQDRFTHQWARETGQTEIIARPQRMQKKDGEVIRHHADFTTALTENLGILVDTIKTTGKKRKALRLILHIMGEDKKMYSSPKRIGLNQTRAGNVEVIRRFMMDPYLIRLTDKIEFFGKQIQGPPEKEEKLVESSLFIPEDEGYNDELI